MTVLGGNFQRSALVANSQLMNSATAMMPDFQRSALVANSQPAWDAARDAAYFQRSALVANSQQLGFGTSQLRTFKDLL